MYTDFWKCLLRILHSVLSIALLRVCKTWRNALLSPEMDSYITVVETDTFSECLQILSFFSMDKTIRLRRLAFADLDLLYRILPSNRFSHLAQLCTPVVSIDFRASRLSVLWPPWWFRIPPALMEFIRSLKNRRFFLPVDFLDLASQIALVTGQASLEWKEKV